MLPVVVTPPNLTYKRCNKVFCLTRGLHNASCTITRGYTRRRWLQTSWQITRSNLLNGHRTHRILTQLNTFGGISKSFSIFDTRNTTTSQGLKMSGIDSVTRWNCAGGVSPALWSSPSYCLCHAALKLVSKLKGGIQGTSYRQWNPALKH